MKRHIDLLGLLYMVGGALSVAAAASLLVLALGAFSIRGNAQDANAALAAGLTGIVLGVIALAMAAWGGANLLAGRSLRALSPRGRIACLTLAVLNLFLLPFGTALSIYAAWVLLHPESRRLLAAEAS